jgi:replication factor C small subunit
MMMRKVYDSLYDVLTPSSIPEAVLIIAKYMRDITIVPDQEVNMLACLTELMMSCEFR